jgi:hypothetical protein
MTKPIRYGCFFGDVPDPDLATDLLEISRCLDGQFIFVYQVEMFFSRMFILPFLIKHLKSAKSWHDLKELSKLRNLFA